MKHLLPPLVLVLGLAAAVTGVWFGFDRGPFERTPVGPEASFWRQAQAGHAGTPTSVDLEAQNEAYVRALAPLAADETGATAHARRVLAALFLPLIGLLTAVLAWKRTGPWPAVAAGVAAAVSAPVILPVGSFDPGVPAAVLLLTAMVILDGRPSVFTLLLGGLISGVAAFLDPVLGWAFVGTAAVWLLIRPPSHRRGVAAGLLVAGWLLGAVGPNLALGGSALPHVSSVEIYRGHRAAASGLNPRRADHDEVRWWTAEDFLIQASVDQKRVVTPRESDRIWRLRALSEMARAPHREIARLGTKTWAMLQGQPLPSTVGAAFLESLESKPGLRIATWLGAVILPLGLVGLWVGRRRATWLLGVGLLTAPVAAWITYAVPETRLCTLAVLAVGFGLFLRAFVDGDNRLRLVVAGVLMVGLFGVLPRFALPGEGIVSQDHFHLGNLYDKEGRGSMATREFDRALNLDPQNVYPRLAVASMLAKDQVMDEAIKELEQLREQHPDFIRGLEMLAQSYASRGRWQDAIGVYEVLVEKFPWRFDYANDLGAIYLQSGYFDQAQAWYNRALQLDPGNATAKANLENMRKAGYVLDPTITDTPKGAAEWVVSFLRNGDVAGADSALSVALQRWRDPKTGEVPAQIRFVEGTLRFQQGRCADAIVAYEAVYSIMESSEIYLNNLGAAYAQCGRLEEAIKTWSQALRLNPGNSVIADQLKRAREQLEQQKKEDGK